jgi:hypothetical protein
LSPIQVENLDAAAAKIREPQLQVSGLTGAVFYRGRPAPLLLFAPLFAGTIANNRPYTWRKSEIVEIRLSDAVKGSGCISAVARQRPTTWSSPSTACTG